VSGDQIVFLAAMFVIIALATVAAHFRWLRSGKVKTAVIFIAGVLAAVCLSLGGIPPKWFDGTGGAFLVALGFLVTGFAARAGEAREFALPLMIGMGLTLLVVNAIALIARHA
jgi:hypothetical protein